VRISGINIDGFGIYSNVNLQDVPDGLVLFTGRNEGGKTTLMEFIRTILFGFPKQKDRNDYKPLKGGKHGGRLRVIMKDGRSISVERFERRAFVTEEGKLPEQTEPSERFLKGTDRQIFECIFAIGLNDLERLDENVRDRMLASSAGIKVPVTSITAQIDTKLSNLLKSGRATNPEINQIVRSLTENRDKIRILHGESSKYEEFHRRLEELEKQVKINKAESESIRQRQNRIKQLEQARSPWTKLCETHKRLNELDYTKNFPPKGLERFERLREDVEKDSREKSNLESKTQQIEIQLKSMVVDENVIGYQDHIDTLMSAHESLANAIRDLPKVKSEMQQKEEEFKKQLKDLGTDWTPERLENVDTSVQTRHRVQKYNHDFESAESKYEQAKIRENNLQDAEKNSKLALDDAQAQFESYPIPSITDIDKLKQKQDTVRKIRSLFYQQNNLAIQLNSKRESLQKEKDELKLLESQKTPSSGQFPSWAWIASLSAGIVFTAISLVFGSYIAGILFILVMSGLSYWLRLSYVRQVKDNAERIRQNQTEIQEQKAIMDQLSEGITDLEARIKAISNEIGLLAQGMGFEKPDSSDEIDKLEGTLEQANDALRDWITLKQKKGESEKNRQDTSERFKEAERETKKAYEELQRLEEEWKSWIIERGFDENIRPEGFEVILQKVENTRTTESSLQSLKSRVDDMEKYIADVRERIYNALETCNIKQRSADVDVAKIDALVRSLKTALDNKKKRDDLRKELDGTNETLESLKRKLDEEQKKLDELLQKSGAIDEEDFFRISVAYKEYQECEQEFKANNKTLMAIAGNEKALNDLEMELNETDSRTLMSEKYKLESQLKELDEGSTGDNQKIGSLETTLRKMVQDDKLSELLFEQKTLQEQLSDATKRWATLVTVRHLIDQARNKYEHERQPEVIKKASRFVKVMTDRPYRLVMPVGNSDIQLEDTETGSYKNEMGWSSGLADQVYLAIRFGLAHDFSEHAESLPIILDDVLVRFDPERQLGTAKVILNLAQNHQVLMFTCHPLTREIIENAFDETGLRDTVALTHYIIDDGIIRSV